MFYVNLNNATYGPYTELQVRQMAASGQVHGGTLVYEQGGNQQWVPASQFPSLFKSPPGSGPPAPNPVVTSIPIAPGDVENTVWRGRPSTLTLLDRFFRPTVMAVIAMVAAGFGLSYLPEDRIGLGATVMAGIVLVFLLWFAWQWILLKTISWTLTTERLCLEKGVLSRTTQNLELYRIKDIRLRRPFLMRLFRRGYVDFVTSDQTEKRDNVKLGAISRPDDLYAMMRKYVERQRQLKGVREVDYWRA